MKTKDRRRNRVIALLVGLICVVLVGCSSFENKREEVCRGKVSNLQFFNSGFQTFARTVIFFEDGRSITIEDDNFSNPQIGEDIIIFRQRINRYLITKGLYWQYVDERLNVR